jgi:hypothetical protein
VRPKHVLIEFKKWMCYIDGQKNKYSVLNECNRMLKYNISKKIGFFITVAARTSNPTWIHTLSRVTCQRYFTWLSLHSRRNVRKRVAYITLHRLICRPEEQIYSFFFLGVGSDWVHFAYCTNPGWWWWWWWWWVWSNRWNNWQMKPKY